jgi:V8-like Glu-specific endopeptidase
MTRTYPIRLFASAMLCASATPSHSLIFDHDDRENVSPVQGSAYSPVGIVTHGVLIWWRATGFLVDDCHVLTSQAIYRYGRAPVGKRVRFEVGIGTPQHASSKGTIVAAGQYERPRTVQEQYERGGGNWLLLRLDQCLGVTFRHVVLKTGPFSPFEFRDLKSAGYPLHRRSGRGVTIDPSCRVFSGTDNLWNNDCATVSGDAGDPIFRISNSGAGAQMEVYAMQAYGWVPRVPVPLTPSLENRAIPMSLIAPLIQPYLSSGPRVVGNQGGSGTPPPRAR